MMKDRKHLVSAEVDKLIEAAKDSRNAARDRFLLLLMFRHGLRVSESCGLKLSQVDIESRVLHVARRRGEGNRGIDGDVSPGSGGRQRHTWFEFDKDAYRAAQKEAAAKTGTAQPFIVTPA